MHQFDPGRSGGYNLDAYVSASRNARARLNGNTGLPTWAVDGNQTTNIDPAFPLDLKSGDYNSLYAALGESDWPVPLPITSESTTPMPYTSTVGDFSGNYTFTNGGPNTKYIQIAVDPMSMAPVAIYEGISTDQYVCDMNTTLTTFTGDRNGVAWTQLDPRLMVWGRFNNVTNYPISPQSTSELRRVLFQQVMGGHIDINFTCPWDSTADVSIADPLTAPTMVGSKMAVFSNSYSTTDFMYGITGAPKYATYGTVVSDNYKYPTISTNMLHVNEASTRKFVLVGGGTSSSLKTSARLIPTCDWAEGPMQDNSMSKYPTVFSGRQIYSVKLQPGNAISFEVHGWVSTNISVDSYTGGGSILVQSCPVTTPHSAATFNIPITVATDWSRSDTRLSEHYVSVKVPLSNHSTGTPPTPVANLGGSSLGSMAGNVLKKFLPFAKDIISKHSGTLKGLADKASKFALSAGLREIARYLPKFAAKAAPLLLL